MNIVYRNTPNVHMCPKAKQKQFQNSLKLNISISFHDKCHVLRCYQSQICLISQGISLIKENKLLKNFL